jgi:putative zinc finger/helix-turn-helix YgiT family protein
MIEQCPLCGGEAAPTRERHEVRVGRRAVAVAGERMRCSACGEGYFLPGQADALQRRAAERIRREEGLLAPEQVRRFRERVGISHAELERLLGTGPKTVVRWECGTVTQSGAADTLLRVLMKHPEALQALARERGVRLDERENDGRRVTRSHGATER